MTKAAEDYKPRPSDRVYLPATTAEHFYMLARSYLQHARGCIRDEYDDYTPSDEERVENKMFWVSEARRCREVARRLRVAGK